MVDHYTKVVLTIIAAALVALVAQQATRPANAQYGSGCGTSSRSPCYIEFSREPTIKIETGLGSIDVRVQ